jgi:hypothetical protein
LIALHAFAVHFRDATAPGVPERQAIQNAVQSLLDNPWSVHSLSSAYLFALGILFAIGSFWKGYRFDDPYPFYGAKYRRTEALRAAYTDEHHLLFDDLQVVREETVEKVRSGITTIPLFPQKAAQIRTQRAAQLEAFRAYESAVERGANQLLRIYRDVNERSRRTPAPSHFREEWRLPHSFLNSAEGIELTADPQSPEPNIPTVLEELRRESDALLDQYSELLRQYPHPTEMGPLK